MKKLKRFSLLIATFFIYILHLPFAIAKTATNVKWYYNSSDSHKVTPTFKSVYDSLQLNLLGLSRQAFEYAQIGLGKLKEQGKLLNDSILSIIDFSQPSSSRRFYVLDLKNYKILFNTLVAHGKNSGKEWANSFSNRPRSLKSSQGFYITGETYNGNKGYSLKLEGVENSINNNAYQRGLVVHGAYYVSESFIDDQGYIGRSEGCPAVPMDEAEPIINQIKDGTCLFVYHPDSYYQHHSPLLN